MRPYEVVVILDAGLEEEAIRSVLDRAADTVKSNGGDLGRIDRWGRRRFAYEVQHRSEGYYALMEMNAEPTTVAALDRVLFLADEVIRHKVIRIPDHVAGRARPGAPPDPGTPEGATVAEAGAQGERS